ncbi:hypothetical protein [Methylobacterium fujisawaense]|uniref:hypothetical protein n=1 Tax=Methylobacterium fujisawaense TaxID=107400 RepID=UPI00313E68B2
MSEMCSGIDASLSLDIEPSLEVESGRKSSKSKVKESGRRTTRAGVGERHIGMKGRLARIAIQAASTTFTSTSRAAGKIATNRQQPPAFPRSRARM